MAGSEGDGGGGFAGCSLVNPSFAGYVCTIVYLPPVSYAPNAKYHSADAPKARSAAGVRTARMDVNATGARSAEGHRSATTAVNAAFAGSAEGHRYASTAANAASARSAEGHRYASTAAYAARARSAEGHRYATTAANAARARSAEGRRCASTAANMFSYENVIVSHRLCLTPDKTFSALRVSRAGRPPIWGGTRVDSGL